MHVRMYWAIADCGAAVGLTHTLTGVGGRYCCSRSSHQFELFAVRGISVRHL